MLHGMSETSSIGAVSNTIRPTGDRNGSRLRSHTHTPDNDEHSEPEETADGDEHKEPRRPPPPGMGKYIDVLV